MFGVSKTENSFAQRWQANVGDHVIALAWSPDGATLAAAAVGGPITLCDGQTGRIKHLLPGHEFGTAALSWSPQGTLLASSGQDGKVRLWNPVDGTEDRVLEAGASWVERVAWSPRGTLLAATAGKKVLLWNRTGQLVQEYANHPSTVADIQWKPGTEELASASYGQIALFHPDQAKPVRTLSWKGSQLVLSWSPDGNYIATGDQDCTVHFWIVKSAEDLMMSGYPTKVRELSWDCSSRFLATGGGSTLCVWDVSGQGPAGKKPIQFEGHKDKVTALSFQHTGRLLASGGAEGMVAIWQPGAVKKPLARANLRAEITQLAWSSDDHSLAFANETGDLCLYRVGSNLKK